MSKDSRGARVQRELKEHLGLEVESVRTLDVYTVDADLTDAQIEEALRALSRTRLFRITPSINRWQKTSIC